MRQIKPNSKIAVGLSGGVDSATAAALLKEQGYEVIGVHMRRTDLGMEGCTAETDMADARRVAEHLDIPFKLYDFRDEYKKRVIDRFVAEYQAGRTPNPDIWCNEEMKFGLFMEKAMEDLGVDYVATGHYARVEARKDAEVNAETRGVRHSGALSWSEAIGPSDRISNHGNSDSISRLRSFQNDDQPRYSLLTGIDFTKDQSYFLYRLNQHQLSKAIFPLGGMLKEEVRAIADKLSLPVAEKPDSVGICFIGDIDLKEFLKQKIDFQPGEVVNTAGEVIGRHDGVQFYTIGQRHGFEITKYQGKPVYVVDKDVEGNRLVVGRDEESNVNSFTVTDLHFIDPSFSARGGLAFGQQILNHKLKDIKVRIRHLGKLTPCEVEFSENLKIGTCDLEIPRRGVAPGQHAVFYRGDQVLGGGVIKSFSKEAL